MKISETNQQGNDIQNLNILILLMNTLQLKMMMKTKTIIWNIIMIKGDIPILIWHKNLTNFVKMAAVADVGILQEIINFLAFVVVFVYVLSF